MSEAGWYPDYEDSTRMRYHDGTSWTEHLHDQPPVETSSEAFEPPVVPAPVTGDVPATKQDSLAVRAASFALLGLVVGLLLGGFVFNAAGAITPVTETTGSANRIEVEYSQGSRNRSYIISGTTAAGEPWMIHDEDAYNTLQSEGYPQPVTIAMGDWTGTPERVTGASFDINHQTTGARIGWAAIIMFIGLIAVVVAWVAARSDSAGPIAAVVFVVFLLGPGSWLGYQAFQWFQSG